MSHDKSEPFKFLENLRGSLNILKKELFSDFKLIDSDDSIINDDFSINNIDPFYGLSGIDEITKFNNRIRSFVLISHAELQGFIEYLARFYVNACIRDFDQSKKISQMLLHFSNSNILHFDFYDTYITNQKNDKLKKNSIISDRLEQMRLKYLDFIKENNSVKDKALVLLFCPLGISIDKIESSEFSLRLTQFGSTRGIYAHTPYHEINKESKSKILKDLFELSNELDLIIDSLKNDLIVSLEILAQ